MKKRKAYSDRYLMKLWREAVLKEFNNSCAFCGYSNIENIECHHFIKRRVKVTRYDWKNGVALCKKCHSLAHTKTGDMRIVSLLKQQEKLEYLLNLETKLYKDYLHVYAMTDNEFLKEACEDLKFKINSY